MVKNNLPTYAIVELLIRLAKHNEAIGDYKDHAVYDNDVIVKTSRGTIIFPQTIVFRQFQSPELIPEDELLKAARDFRPAI
jgi:hypothetical protein